MTTHRFHVRATSLVVIGLLALTGCGGSDDEASDPASASSSAGTPDPPQGLGDQAQAIQECLEAAGLGDKFPSGMPSGMPSDGFPSGGPPSGMPTDGMPTEGMPSGAPPGGGLNDPEIQAALEACGISLPSAPPS